MSAPKKRIIQLEVTDAERTAIHNALWDHLLDEISMDDADYQKIVARIASKVEAHL